MNRGVLYYNHGVRCLARLSVSLHSLRRHYQGPVAIACEGTIPEPYRSILSSLGAQFINAPVSNEFGLVKKSRVWRLSPYKHTLFLDADTLILSPVDELFAKTEQFGTVVTKFHDWKTARGRMARRIKQWESLTPALVKAALAYGWAINTGVQGWTKGEPILEEYQKLTEQGVSAGVGRKTLDEIAMQLLIPKHRHYLAGSEWNFGPIYGDPSTAKILHFHGHKHCREGSKACDSWKAEFSEMASGIGKDIGQKTEDPSIDVWLEQLRGYRKDMTIVTAVNPAYAERAAKNIKLWMETPGLKEQKFIVFVNGFKGAKDRRFLNLPNVEVIRWDYPFEATARETMLASFVLGTARYVKTPYWMKLDGDAAPIKGRFEWPDYHKYTVTSHKWGYSKMKGEENPKDHWFNRFDKVFSPNAPMFKTKLDPKADFHVSHRPGNKHGIPMRFASFCHIEKTSFTKRIAKIVNDKCGGRLPAPSHDTTAWYCATLWKEPVRLMNMKEWFQP